MYRMLTTLHNDKTCVFDTQYREQLTPTSIIDEFGLNNWNAKSAPNHKADGSQIARSYHIYRDNVIPSTNPTEMQGKVLNPYLRKEPNLIQFRDAVKWFDYFVSEGLLTIESSLILDDDHIGVTCDLGLENSLPGGDSVQRYFILAFGYSSGFPKMLGFTDLRPICSNTLQASAAMSFAKAGAAFDLSADPEKALVKARGAIDFTRRQFREIAVPYYRNMYDVKVTSDERDSLFRKLVGMPLAGVDAKVTDKVAMAYEHLESAYQNSPGMELFDRKDCNAWRVLQAVTWASQNSPVKTNAANYISRFSSSNVRRTYEWASMRMDNTVLPANSRMLQPA